MLQAISQQASTLLVDFVRLLLWLVILSTIFLPLERLFALKPQTARRQDLQINLAYYFLNGLLGAVLLGVPLSLLAWVAHRLVPDSLHQLVSGWPFWLRAVAIMVVGEFGYYWGHRWTHEIPFLWRFHAVHHSAERLDFLVNTRIHPFDLVFVRFCGLVPIYILGLAAPTVSGSSAPLLIILVGTIWGFFIHANLRWRLGPLEWLISTPAFHHWHHTRSEHTDRNYAPMLPFVDSIFGTRYLPRDRWPASYGIDGQMADTFGGQLVQPLKSQP